MWQVQCLHALLASGHHMPMATMETERERKVNGHRHQSLNIASISYSDFYSAVLIFAALHSEKNQCSLVQLGFDFTTCNPFVDFCTCTSPNLLLILPENIYCWWIKHREELPVIAGSFRNVK